MNAKPLQQCYDEAAAKLEAVVKMRPFLKTEPFEDYILADDGDQLAQCFGRAVDCLTAEAVAQILGDRANLCPGLAAELLAQLRTAWTGCKLGGDQAVGEKFVRRIAKASGIEGA